MLGFKNCAPPCVPVWQREARLLACLVINVKATWECLPLVWTMWSHVSFFPPFILWTLSLIHSRGADWLSAVWVQRGTVFISLAFCCLWSVSCWLRVNTQHLITSPGFCLKGHWEPVCTHREGAGNDGKLAESSLKAAGCQIVYNMQLFLVLKSTLKTSWALICECAKVS